MLPAFIPDPLHPAVVHLPVALALLAPLAAAGALVAIRRGAAARPAWAVALAALALLVGSSWVALETGEAQEDRVERVVAEAALERHEEAAELFMVAGVVVLGLATAGLARGRIGGTARGVATVGTLALLGVGWNVGHSGGELVYRHGAASAYAEPAARRVAADAPLGARAATAARDVAGTHGHDPD